MNEELKIKAFEILERKIDFTELTENEQHLVIQAFGSKESYHSMISLSGIAEEEEEIMAPSLRTEGELLTAFKTKHSTDEAVDKKKNVFTLHYLKWLRIGFPLAILVLGFLWLSNSDFLETPNVAHTEESRKEQEPLKPATEDELQLEQESKSDSEFEKLEQTRPIQNENDPAILKEEIDEIVNGSEVPELLVIHDEEADLEMTENESDLIFEDTDTRFDNSISLPSKDSEGNIIPSSDNITNGWLGNNKVSEVNDSSLDIQSEIRFSDDSYGNSAFPTENEVVQTERQKRKLFSKDGKLNKASLEEMSSNAKEDLALMEFLFSTY